MGKSTLLKLIILVLVLATASLAYLYNSQLQNYLSKLNPSSVNLSKINPPKPSLDVFNFKPVTSEVTNTTLNLSSPDDNQLVFDSNLLLQGKTTPGSTVLVSFEDSDMVVEVAENGDFSSTVYMDEGLNEFSVTAIDKAGNTKQEERTIYYSKEKI